MDEENMQPRPVWVALRHEVMANTRTSKISKLIADSWKSISMQYFSLEVSFLDPRNIYDIYIH